MSHHDTAGMTMRTGSTSAEQFSALPSSSSHQTTSSSRPSSAASHRTTTSRTSHRPISRISQRSSTRQSTRIVPLYQALVKQLTGFASGNGDDYDYVLDQVAHQIDSIAKQAAAPDMRTVQRQLRSFSRKARIQSHDNLANALDICNKHLSAELLKPIDLDGDISASKLPEHLQFLILLALPPSVSTLKHADDIVDRIYNPPPAAEGFTWKDILAEEPFEGQHWEGAYGLEPGNVVGDWGASSPSDSSPSLSALSDTDSGIRDEVFSIFSSSELSRLSETELTPELLPSPQDTLSDQFPRTGELLGALQKRQYWRAAWCTDADTNRDFVPGDSSTLGPAHNRIAKDVTNRLSQGSINEKYIDEHDALREVLLALQGRPSILFEQQGADDLPEVVVLPRMPHLLHLTPLSQQSILSDFSRLATILARLRKFSGVVLSCMTSTSAEKMLASRTCEAFSEALDLQIARLEAWLAAREELFLRAHLQNGESTVISLLSLRKAIQAEFSILFDILLETLDFVFPNSSWLGAGSLAKHIHLSPSAFSSRLLGRLFDGVQEKQSFGDFVSAAALFDVFVHALQPIWRMLGRWLVDGTFMPGQDKTVPGHPVLPREFFIESNGLDIFDPDFWVDGFEIRSNSTYHGASPQDKYVPTLLLGLADQILGAGKSIGLLRLLGAADKLDRGNGLLSSSNWPSFRLLMNVLLSVPSLKSDDNPIEKECRERTRYMPSAEDFSMLLSEQLMPICVGAGKALRNVLYVDCEFLHHLHAIEDLFLMNKGDVIAEFCEILFSAMDVRKAWTDYHFLNTAFRDAAESLKRPWINLSLVRLSYKPNQFSSLQRSVRNLSGLTVEYSAPFPLQFVFDKFSSQIYNAIFILLMQIRRAKAPLDNILLLDPALNSVHSRSDLKVFYLTRSKLSWFVNTLLNFICSHVLHVKTEKFHKNLNSAGSLDEIISLHLDHLKELERMCALHEKTSTLNRALLSIMDMCMRFSDSFIAFVGESAVSTSRNSEFYHSHSRRHRSRRLRRENRNVVTLERMPTSRDEESSMSDSDLDELIIPQEFAETTVSSLVSTLTSESAGATEEDFFNENEKMGNDLDTLVKCVRREVDRLAMNGGSQAWSILSFYLQDWDL